MIKPLKLQELIRVKKNLEEIDEAKEQQKNRNEEDRKW